MAKISIRSVAPTFRRAGIQFSRLDAVEVDTDTLTEDQRAQLAAELESGRNLVLAPNTQPAKKDADGSVPGGEKAAGAPSVKAPTGNAKRSAAKAAGKAK
jgi:hypothetical protein